MSNNIYLILFVFLVLCVIIIFTKTQKKALPPVPTEEPFVENIGELIDISMIKEKSVKSKLLITRLDVVGAGEDANFPNKHLLIEGTNLDKLEDVYFGDLKGIILQNENIGANENIKKNTF